MEMYKTDIFRVARAPALVQEQPTYGIKALSRPPKYKEITSHLTSLTHSHTFRLMPWLCCRAACTSLFEYKLFLLGKPRHHFLLQPTYPAYFNPQVASCRDEYSLHHGPHTKARLWPGRAANPG